MRRRLLLAALLVTAAAACSEPEPEPITDPGGSDAGTVTTDAGGQQESDGGSTDSDAGSTSDAGSQGSDAGTPAGTVIGAAGGTVTGQGVRLDVPAGALSADVEITVEQVVQSAPANVTALSPFFKFGPEGTTFSVPVPVTLTAPAALPTNARIYWSKAAGAPGFDELTTNLDGSTASATVTHFSIGFIGAPATTNPGTCEQQDGMFRDLLQPYPPVTTPVPYGGLARIQFGGTSTMYLLYGGTSTNTTSRGYGSETFISTDGNRFDSASSYDTSSDSDGRALDAAADRLYELATSGNDLKVRRRQAGGCAEELSTLAGAFPSGSHLLSVLPDGSIFGILHKRNPNEHVAIASSDGGATWTEKGQVRGNLAVFAPSNPQQLHVGGGWRSGGMPQLHTSRDGGATWTTSTVPSGTILTGNYAVQSIAVDPGDANIVYAVSRGGTAQGLYRSADGGATFPQPKVSITGTPESVTYSADRRLWLATSTGLYVRGPTDTDFTAVDGDLPADQLATFAVGFQGSTIWRLGSRLVKSSDGGATWTDVAVKGFPGLTTEALLTDPSDGNTFYVRGGHAPLYRTSDSGATFAPVAQPSGSGTPLRMMVTGNGVLLAFGYFGTEVGARSTDGGATWQSVSGLTGNDWRFDEPDKVLVHDTGGTVYAQDDLTNLFRSDDDGATWTLVQRLVPAGASSYMLKLTVDPATPKRLFMFRNVDLANPELLVSTDGGATFTALTLPQGVMPQWDNHFVDRTGRLWLTSSGLGGWVVDTLDAGATTFTRRTVPPGVTLPLFDLGGAVYFGHYKTTDGGATWIAPDTSKPSITHLAQGLFSHRGDSSKMLFSLGTLRLGAAP